MKKNILALFFGVILLVLLPDAAFTQANCPACNIPNANYVFNNGNTISNQSFSNDIIEINGTVYIDGTCVFDRCEFYLSEQARIELIPGPTELFLHSNEFFNCCPLYMWDGIYTTDQDNYIFARNNYFLHGENVIVEAFGAEVILNSNEFDRCYYPLTLRDWSGSPRIEFRGNYIQSINPITAAPIPGSGKTQVGVRAIDYVSTGGNILTIGDASSSAFTNSFEEIEIAISSENSSVIIVNNYVTKTTGAFLVSNSGNYITCHIGGTNQFDSNIIEDVNDYGMRVSGYIELDVINNQINGGPLYGIDMINIVFNTKALITSNNIIFGKYNHGSCGIRVHDFSGDFEISYNTIETHLYQGVPANIGSGINIQFNQPCETERIEVKHNTIENTQGGVNIFYIYSIYIDVISNTHTHSTAASDFALTGISVNDCFVERKITIEDNNIENARHGIFANNSDNCDITYNNITYSSLPITTNWTRGIDVEWCQNVYIRENNISMTNGLNTVCWNYYNFRVMFLNEVSDLAILGNQTFHTRSGLTLVQGVMPSYIFCNVFDHSLYGVELYYGWHGILRNTPPPVAQVGTPDMPANNEWHNHFCGTRRISGYPSSYFFGTEWYYKTGTEFEIDPAIHLDFWGGGSLNTFLTPEIQDPCATLKANPIVPSENLSQQQFTLLGNGQKDSILFMMFGIIDSIIGYSPTATIFSMPTGVTQYEMVRNAYKVMVKNPWIFNGGTTTANKYQTIKNFLYGSNIHKLITMDTLVSTKYLSQLNSEVGSFIPQNQIEINAKSYFSAMTNFISNNHSLSVSDSSILLAVATQSTFTGGYAVQKARNMLNLFIADSLIYPVNPTPSMKLVLTEDASVGSVDRQNEISVRLYPNPARDVIFIEKEGVYSIDNLRMDIYRFTGELIISNYIGSNNISAISTSELNNGIFLYRITKDNSILQQGKFVVNK